MTIFEHFEMKLVRNFVIFTIGSINSPLNESNFRAIVKIDGFRTLFDDFSPITSLF